MNESEGVEGSQGMASDPPVRGDAITEVQRILEAELSPPAETQADPAEADPPEPQRAEKLDIKSVAERLGVDPGELYGALKVKLADGEELSVGDLKDRLKPQAEIETLKQNLTKARGEWEASKIRQSRELQAILSAIPQQAVSPQLLELHQSQRAERLSREREALLRAIPEWADTGVITAERKQLSDYLAETGWPEGTVDAIEDHRLFVTLRAAAQDRAELQKLRAEKAKAEQPRPKVAAKPQPARPQTEGQRFGQIKGSVASGRMSPVSAVEKLLSGAVAQGPRTGIRR